MKELQGESLQRESFFSHAAAVCMIMGSRKEGSNDSRGTSKFLSLPHVLSLHSYKSAQHHMAGVVSVLHLRLHLLHVRASYLFTLRFTELHFLFIARSARVFITFAQLDSQILVDTLIPFYTLREAARCLSQIQSLAFLDATAGPAMFPVSQERLAPFVTNQHSAVHPMTLSQVQQ